MKGRLSRRTVLTLLKPAKMPTASMKRCRSPTEPVTAGRSVTSIKSTLASRVSHFDTHLLSNPPFSTDSFLISLGISVTESLRTVSTLEQAARSRVREIRATLHAGIDTRCDELDASVCAAAAAKTAALERELVAVDAALEYLRSTCDTVREAVTTLTDADLVEQQVALSSRLDVLDAQLRDLPTGVVETPYIGVSVDVLAMLADLSVCGRVLAPISITARDLTFQRVASDSAAVYPSSSMSLRLRLSLGARHARQVPEELDVSLGSLLRATRVDAGVWIDGPVRVLEPMLATLSPDSGRRCLFIALSDPQRWSAGVCVCIARITVAGQPMAGFPVDLPLRGICAPLRLDFACSIFVITPSISPEGLLFSPLGSEIRVFNEEGRPRSSISVAGIGLSTFVRCSAYYNHGDIPALLLADFSGQSARVVSVDLATYSVIWVAGAIPDCMGMTVLYAQGVVLLCSSSYETLVAHRLSDGARVSSVKVRGYLCNIAGDTSSGTVFGGCENAGVSTIHAWTWAVDVGINATRVVAVAGTEDKLLIVSVMPPAPGKRTSQLIVGVLSTPELRVLSLPDLILLHVHVLDGVEISGLASDPWGRAFAVCDTSSKAIHVLPWPLSGMPQLD